MAIGSLCCCLDQRLNLSAKPHPPPLKFRVAASKGPFLQVEFSLMLPAAAFPHVHRGIETVLQ
jgi:hypothetical protein